MPMSMIRTIGGLTMEEMLHPPSRVVDFSHDGAVLSCATLFRIAWTVKSKTESYDFGDIDHLSDSAQEQLKILIRILQSTQPVPSPEDLGPIRNPDKDELHTSLRDLTYHMFNHVFLDVSRFLTEAAHGVGHFHPPNEQVVGLSYPTFESGEKAKQEIAILSTSFPKPIMLLPVWLEPGVRMKVVVGGVSGESQADQAEGMDNVSGGSQSHQTSNGIVYDATQAAPDEVYQSSKVLWVKAGEEIKLFLSGIWEGERDGLAAVFVYGTMCDRVAAFNDDSPIEDHNVESDNPDSPTGDAVDPAEGGLAVIS